MLPIEIRNYYAILEIPLSASLEEARLSHRRLAVKWHPDRLSSACKPHTGLDEASLLAASAKELSSQDKIREINRALTEIESYFQSPRDYLRGLKRQSAARKQGRKLRAKWEHKHGRSRKARLDKCLLKTTETFLTPLDHLATILLGSWASSKYFVSYFVGIFSLCFLVAAIGSPNVKFLIDGQRPGFRYHAAPTKAQAQVDQVILNVANAGQRMERLIKTAKAEISSFTLPNVPLASVTKRATLPNGYRTISNRHPVKQIERPRLNSRYS